MNRFDWTGLMEAGRGVGLRPAEFWRLTPAELAFVLAKSGQSTPLGLARWEYVAQACPDDVRVTGDGRHGQL